MTHPSKHTLRLVSTTKTKTQSNLIWAGNFSRIAPKLMIANFRSPSWRRQLRPPEATDAEQSEWKPFDSRMGGNSKRGPSRLRHTRVHRGVPGRKREPMECSLGNHSLQRSKSPVQGSGQHDLDYIQWIYKSKLDRIYRFLTKYTKNHCVCFPHPRFVAVGHSLTLSSTLSEPDGSPLNEDRFSFLPFVYLLLLQGSMSSYSCFVAIRTFFTLHNSAFVFRTAGCRKSAFISIM